MLSGGRWPDHRVVGAVRLPARAGRPGARRQLPSGTSGGVLRGVSWLPVGVVPPAARAGPVMTAARDRQEPAGPSLASPFRRFSHWPRAPGVSA
jgi:hypothetical protein